jgi:hypothetical protein
MRYRDRNGQDWGRHHRFSCDVSGRGAVRRRGLRIDAPGIKKHAELFEAEVPGEQGHVR